jgi:hypothetical protein
VDNDGHGGVAVVVVVVVAVTATRPDEEPKTMRQRNQGRCRDCRKETSLELGDRSRVSLRPFVLSLFSFIPTFRSFCLIVLSLMGSFVV